MSLWEDIKAAEPPQEGRPASWRARWLDEPVGLVQLFAEGLAVLLLLEFLLLFHSHLH